MTGRAGALSQRGLSLLLVLLLCCSSSVLFAHDPTTESSALSQTDLKIRLLRVSAKLASLEQAWGEQKRLLKQANETLLELEYELMTLRELLASSERSLAISQGELERSETSLETLQQRLEILLTDFQEYRAEVEKTLRRRQIELWIWRAATAVALLIAVLT